MVPCIRAISLHGERVSRAARSGASGLSRLLARPVALTALAACLLGLLVLLATLQYRWLGQLGEAELARLHGGTRVRTAELAQDFNREITRAYLWLRLDPATARARDGERFATLYDRWRREAPHPRLVEGIFLLETGADGRPRVLRFNPDERAFEPGLLPPSLERLPGPMPPAAAPGERGRRTFFEPIWEDGPALLSPLPAFESRPEREVGPPGPPQWVGYAVVLLDREYLVRKFIPALVERHLPTTDEFEPLVKITSRQQPGRVIYDSASADGVGAMRPESPSVPLFAISVGEANRDLLAGLDFRKDFERRLSTIGPHPRGEAGAVTRSRAMRAEVRGFMVPPPEGTGARWHMTLTYRGGSLEDVVAGVRRRNLIVSFGIMLVLGLSVVTTVVATQRAQRLARAEVEFVAGVSHELSTPLSVICVAGENLADGLLGGGEPVRRYGALVRDEGRRLRELVEQVLEFSAPGSPLPRRNPVNLHALVESAMQGCRTEIDAQHFQVRMEIARDLPVVMGDVAMLRRAVQNLLSNAIKYSGISRGLSVRVATAPPGHGQQVWLTVQDGGLGIDPAELPRIFQPFYRSRDARARQIRGTGLGLSLVRKIVEQHGGTVTVDSQPGHGSSFTIRLPVSEHATAGASPAPVEVHGEQAHPAG